MLVGQCHVAASLPGPPIQSVTWARTGGMAEARRVCVLAATWHRGLASIRGRRLRFTPKGSCCRRSLSSCRAAGAPCEEARLFTAYRYSRGGRARLWLVLKSGQACILDLRDGTKAGAWRTEHTQAVVVRGVSVRREAKNMRARMRARGRVSVKPCASA